MRGMKRPEHYNHRRPRSSAHLRWRGDSSCGKSPDTAYFPLSITNEGVEVMLLPNPHLSFSTIATNSSAGAGEENEAKTSKKERDLKGHQQGEHD
jgi:hypothetical protein